MSSRRRRGGRAFAPLAQGLVECTGYSNTNLFTGQALGPDLDRLRLIGAPAAVVHSIIITAPTIKFFIIGAALLPLVRREIFDTLQDPLRFSVGPIAAIDRLHSPIRRHAARVAARDDGPAAANRVEIWIHRREYPPIESELTGVGISGRAAPLSAELSEWSSCLLVNFQACPKRRPRQQ